MLIANTSLTSVVVNADGEVGTYTFSNSINDSTDVLDFSDGTTTFDSGSFDPSADGGKYFPAGNITVTQNISLNTSLTLKVTLNGETVTPTENVCSISTGFRVVGLGINAEDEGVLELMPETAPANNQGNDSGGTDAGGDQQGDQHNDVKVTIKITSNIVRKVHIDSEEFDVCYDQLENDKPNLQNQTITREINFIPDKIEIENPGGVGVEHLGRLVSVTINDEPCEVTARYDKCSYELSGITNGDTITIVLAGDNTSGGVIEWTNYYCDEQHRQGNISAEEQFKYGSAKIVGVYAADDTDFTNNIMKNYGIDEKGCVDEYGNGGLRLENGFWIAFEFVPLPGYQLVEFGGGAGGQGGSLDIGTTDRPNVYFFQMPQSNVHFTAVFDTPENIVKIKGESIVSDGDIVVAENEFEGGTAQMTVGSLNSDTRSAYDANNDVQAALDKDNLEIEEYLSLDLANIYQKANTDEYWENDYHKLTEGDATVTLKVDDNFNPDNNKVYIVHDKGGDEGIETIEAEYDPNTHEITFETGSFSNFMIATSDEANDIDVKPNDPPKPGDPEPGEPQPGEPPVPGEEDPGEYVPRFDVALVDDEPALGNWEGDEKNRFFEYVEIGQAIPGDAEINNALPDDLPDDCKLIYFINGEEVASFGMDERGEPFLPGHFVTFEKITATENTFEVYFNECWVVGIEVMQLDLSMKALDKDGKVIEPVGGSDKDGALIFECGDAGEEDFTYFEIAYPVCPAEVVVKGINDYAIFYLECNEKDMFNTPIGENSIEYPSEDDYIWIGAWGMVPDSETVNFTDSLTKVSAVFEGVSEDKIDDYLLLVTEFDTSDASEEEIAAFKKQIAEKGYDISEFPLGFDITLYDKNGEVHEPGFTVRITLVLEKALDLEDGETVLILHKLDDDKFEIIEAVYNAKDLTLTFETKSFSPFVVAFGTKAAPASVVKTGEDIATTRIVIASLLIGAAAAAGILFIRRRESEIEKEEN